jgi:hypothetical protein
MSRHSFLVAVPQVDDMGETEACPELVEAEVEEKIFNNRFVSVISIPSWWR